MGRQTTDSNISQPSGTTSAPQETPVRPRAAPVLTSSVAPESAPSGLTLRQAAIIESLAMAPLSWAFTGEKLRQQVGPELSQRARRATVGNVLGWPIVIRGAHGLPVVAGIYAKTEAALGGPSYTASAVAATGHAVIGSLLANPPSMIRNQGGAIFSAMRTSPSLENARVLGQTLNKGVVSLGTREAAVIGAGAMWRTLMENQGLSPEVAGGLGGVFSACVTQPLDTRNGFKAFGLDHEAFRGGLLKHLAGPQSWKTWYRGSGPRAAICGIGGAAGGWLIKKDREQQARQ